MPRILALDVGEKRIGVAVSDALNITAQGVTTIKRASAIDTVAEIRALMEQYGSSKIIIGMPFNMDGTKGRSAEMVEEFASFLKLKLPAEIEMIDERLTSSQGERILLDADISRKKRKSAIDKIAAQLILQAYLDSHVQKDRTE